MPCLVWIFLCVILGATRAVKTNVTSYNADETHVIRRIYLSTPPFRLDSDSGFNDGVNVDFVIGPMVEPKQNLVFEMYTHKSNRSKVLACNHDPGVLKLVRDAIVWRGSELDIPTYVRSSNTFFAITRCGTPTQPELPRKAELLKPVIQRAVVVASHKWSKYFYHHTSETLIPLALARFVIELDPDIVILIDKIHGFSMNLFSLIGLENRTFIELEHSGPVLVRELYVPVGIRCGGSRAGIVAAFQQWLHSYHPRLYDQNIVNATDIVIMDRRDGGVCNHCLPYYTDLIEKLKVLYPSRVVKGIIPGEMTPFEVMQVLARADVLIAGHGSGLVQLIFLPSNASVIEVHNRRSTPTLCFRSLAACAQLNYVGIDGTGGSTHHVEKIIAALSSTLNIK